MASSELWDVYCPKKGFEHALLLKDYPHCSFCGKSNPNAPNLPRSIREQSVLAERAVASSSRSTAPIAAVPGHIAFGERSRVADTARQAAFTRRRAGVPNAGSRAITAPRAPSQPRQRPAPASSIAVTSVRERVFITITSQLLKLTYRGESLQWKAATPSFHDNWSGLVTQRAFNAVSYDLKRLCLDSRTGPASAQITALFENERYLNHYLCAVYEPQEEDLLPDLELSADITDLKDALAGFTKTTAHGFKIWINFVIADSAKTYSRYFVENPQKESESRSPSPPPSRNRRGVASSNQSKTETSASSVTLAIRTSIEPVTSEVSQSIEPNPEQPAIKQEKPEWTSRAIDTTAGPVMIDLEASQSDRSESELLEPSALVPSRKHKRLDSSQSQEAATAASKPVDKPQKKKKKVVEKSPMKLRGRKKRS